MYAGRPNAGEKKVMYADRPKKKSMYADRPKAGREKSMYTGRPKKMCVYGPAKGQRRKKYVWNRPKAGVLLDRILSLFVAVRSSFLHLF